MTDEHGTLLLPGPGTGCRAGHAARPSPDVNPVLGMVPAKSATWFGAVVLILVVGLLWWLLPATRIWVLLGLLGWVVAVLSIQLALGHRGSCLLRRTVRWFFGPIGALVDPFDLD